MELHDNIPVETSESNETVTTASRQTHRLYPSLPGIDRYDILPDRTVGEKQQAAEVHYPERRHGDTKLEALAASSDVRMKAQILILEEQRQELLTINEKWAKEYRTMSLYYKEKVRDLKASLQYNPNPLDEEKEQREGQTNTSQDKDKENIWAADAEVRLRLLQAEEEAKELREENSRMSRRGQHQGEEIRRLNKALSEALSNAQPDDISSETLQEVWKHQAEVYKEDFLKERRDREKLKEKYLELEKKFRKVHNELRVLKPQVTRARPPQPAHECSCANQAKNREIHPSNKLQRCYNLDNEM